MNEKETREPGVLRLRLEIDGLTPVVHRVIEIKNDIKLHDLHKVIQIVMGWRNEYPACFISPSGSCPIGDWPEPGSGQAPATLGELCDNPQREFFYDYEPGEPWRVIGRVEAERPPESGEALPVCLAGECAAPPDGVGGREGYADFLRMLDDPEADEDELEDMMEWAGGDFDPERFDLAAVNRRLKKSSE